MPGEGLRLQAIGLVLWNDSRATAGDARTVGGCIERRCKAHPIPTAGRRLGRCRTACSAVLGAPGWRVLRCLQLSATL